MSKLIAFGDSITYGFALDDNLNIEKPSIYAWPNLVAKELNLEVINLGQPGASNKEIWYNIINYSDFSSNNTVIINWNTAQRFCFFDEDGTKRLGMSTRYADKRATDIFYKNFYSENDLWLDTNLRINHAQNFLDQKGVNVYHSFTSGPSFRLTSWNNKCIIIGNSMFEYRENDKALDGTHPGKNAHKLYAQSLLNDLRGKNETKI